jgi:hypothetical protein
LDEDEFIDESGDRTGCITLPLLVLVINPVDACNPFGAWEAEHDMRCGTDAEFPMRAG